MRVTFNLSPNYRRIIPFDYQQQLVGRIHQWLGENSLHDEISLYSLSWLGFNGQVRNGGLYYPNGTHFHVSAANDELMADIIAGLQRDTEVNWGMRVTSIMPQREPTFGTSARFIMQSPVLVKRQIEDGSVQFYYYKDEMAATYMTQTMQAKMKHAGVVGRISLRFDRSFPNPKIKMCTYRKINNKASLCPVIAEGDPHCIAFAWNVGIGNSTGIGFGAIK
ncbi:CRISPR-associated endoribonuclease Cas6 [Lewinella marina]|uniref:CRISPR-associated endoribonuclease Cas6 n=1 Tax=Neolewinella marina TaxID=438751 RepID=A0A2G0CK62_9BACT|nr:CRISPR-associated endoribonuclease Cas6 [Neolewinella marina]NJB84453.1 CRISPR-associated endoribonuclease Cas6 [Neolewinella marina]PHL00355.1 CRISPR-associated endoribonuclease Cas6 [Neolewinella marina]